MDPYGTLLYNNPKMSDIKFLVGEDTYYGHKLILSYGSDVFYTMFNGEIPFEEDSLTFSDLSMEAFEIFLKYIYHLSVDLTGIQMKDVLGAMKLTHQYMLDQSTTVLVTYIHENLDVDCVALVWEMGFLYSQISQPICVKFAIQHGEAFFNTLAFFETSENFLVAVLESENLDVPELTIFNHLLKWAQHKHPNVADQEELIKLYVHIFDLVRYPLIPAKEFYDSIVAKDLLSKEDCIAVLARIAADIECRFTSKPRRKNCELSPY